MNLMMPTRREFTAGLGSIIVSFSLDPKLAFAQQAAKLPGSLAENRMLDAWIRVNADGSATIFPGKVELGQGITTALTQIAAEELDNRSPACVFLQQIQLAAQMKASHPAASLLNMAAPRCGLRARKCAQFSSISRPNASVSQPTRSPSPMALSHRPMDARSAMGSSRRQSTCIAR
jgi:hypothetical protein